VKSLRQAMTGADLGVILLVLGMALAGTAWWLAAPAGARVVVSIDGRTVYTAPLDRPREFDLEGPCGTTRLAIAADGARIVAASCPQKVCMGMGPARRSGELIACLPNRLLLEIRGSEEEGGYDLLSR